jgi:hypothetical protein
VYNTPLSVSCVYSRYTYRESVVLLNLRVVPEQSKDRCNINVCNSLLTIPQHKWMKEDLLSFFFQEQGKKTSFLYFFFNSLLCRAYSQLVLHISSLSNASASGQSPKSSTVCCSAWEIRRGENIVCFLYTVRLVIFWTCMPAAAAMRTCFRFFFIIFFFSRNQKRYDEESDVRHEQHRSSFFPRV